MTQEGIASRPAVSRSWTVIHSCAHGTGTHSQVRPAPTRPPPFPPHMPFSPIPLGHAIPDLPHAVSCSLPTMRAVCGYEVKAPEVIAAMRGGYPRFVLHRFVKKLTDHYAKACGSARYLWLTSSAQMAEQVRRELARSGHTAQVHDFDGIDGVSHDDSPAIAQLARLFLQNTGGFLASRAAEDRLAQLGLVPAPQPEAAFGNGAPDRALVEIRRQLAPLFPENSPDSLMLAPNGMNAVYAAFSALAEAQAAQGRHTWVQLGWLYLDTIALLKHHARDNAQHYCYLPDVFDLAALETLFAQRGAQIAGLVIEAPTNPLIQTPDLPAIYTLAKKHGAAVIVDPSVSSIYSVDVLPYADVVCSSLTKYTASEGDLVAGLVVVNPHCANADSLHKSISTRLDPVYPRDLARLAHQIAATPDVLAKVERSTATVAAWLEAHPSVKRVAWAHSPESRANYQKLARHPDAVGGLISFTLRGPIEAFYDAVSLPKGPSFGMQTTLLCPFIYLAHYDLVTSEAGRRELAASGLEPELLRLSVGCEPVEDLIAALDAALSQAPADG
ncbi:hypothetical protein AXK12_05845 [Cephaloticoccus capnophilus]|uniref:Cystathionine gamma-synthase n=2 Tax=Cephaloticoccus capnophilus TaxID=1548208 RepID=A0A139SKZ0_9BACT|nr:hypothetical protein AXK12_05845 [Cephaloticoccus capnophilus]